MATFQSKRLLHKPLPSYPSPVSPIVALKSINTTQSLVGSLLCVIHLVLCPSIVHQAHTPGPTFSQICTISFPQITPSPTSSPPCPTTPPSASTPSSQPSSLPLPQLSSQSSSQPSSQPSCQFSSPPSSQPSAQPSSQPLCQCSSHPTPSQAIGHLANHLIKQVQGHLASRFPAIFTVI